MAKDYWQQGTVFNTPITEHFTKEERARYQADEERMVFRNFTVLDLGQSRQRVAIFDHADDAKRAVADHNTAEDIREAD